MTPILPDPEVDQRPRPGRPGFWLLVVIMLFVGLNLFGLYADKLTGPIPGLFLLTVTVAPVCGIVSGVRNWRGMNEDDRLLFWCFAGASVLNYFTLASFVS